MAYSFHNCLPNLLPPFPEFKESVLTPEQIANNLRDEMKRLKKRREFRGQVRCGVLKMQLFTLERLIAHDVPYICIDILQLLRQGPPSPGSAPSSPEPMLEAHMMEGQAGPSSSPSSSTTSAKQDKPIFTLKQMSMIGEATCYLYFHFM